jgi:hypothetical protein
MKVRGGKRAVDTRVTSERVIRFVEAGALDAGLFEAILRRHHLMDRWRKFQNTYLNS